MAAVSQPGTTPPVRPLTRHYGIELPDGTMCENSPAGVRVVGFADFTRGRASRVANPDASPDVRALGRAAGHVPRRRAPLQPVRQQLRALRELVRHRDSRQPAGHRLDQLLLPDRGAGNNRAVSTATASSFLNAPGRMAR